jgi:metallo-beta-lactamase family protein
VDIYVDSPLSVNVTAIFKRHPECFDEETSALVAAHDDPLGFNRLTYVQSKDESKRLNEIDRPCIIISASGMCEGGRVLHHLRHTLGDPRNCVLIVGFQAEGTLGKKLVDKWPRVRILGEDQEARAQVEVLNGFSAHADRNEILSFLRGFDQGLGHVILVHGEEKQAASLAEAVKGLRIPVEVPAYGSTIEL